MTYIVSGGALNSTHSLTETPIFAENQSVPNLLGHTAVYLHHGGGGNYGRQNDVTVTPCTKGMTTQKCHADWAISQRHHSISTLAFRSWFRQLTIRTATQSKTVPSYYVAAKRIIAIPLLFSPILARDWASAHYLHTSQVNTGDVK